MKQIIVNVAENKFDEDRITESRFLSFAHKKGCYINKMALCQTCNGFGWLETENSGYECPTCNGLGMVERKITQNIFKLTWN